MQCHCCLSNLCYCDKDFYTTHWISDQQSNIRSWSLQLSYYVTTWRAPQNVSVPQISSVHVVSSLQMGTAMENAQKLQFWGDPTPPNALCVTVVLAEAVECHMSASAAGSFLFNARNTIYKLDAVMGSKQELLQPSSTNQHQCTYHLVMTSSDVMWHSQTAAEEWHYRLHTTTSRLPNSLDLNPIDNKKLASDTAESVQMHVGVNIMTLPPGRSQP